MVLVDADGNEFRFKDQSRSDDGRNLDSEPCAPCLQDLRVPAINNNQTADNETEAQDDGKE